MTSAELQQVTQSKTINVNRRPDELLALLTALATADVAAETTAKRWGCTAGLAAVIGVIASFMMMTNHGEGAATLLGVTVVFVIFCIVMYVRAKKGDVSNNFRVTAIPFITLLKQDMAPESRLHVKIDLREAAIKEKLKRQSDPYKAGAYDHVVDFIYDDPWFTGETEFADGTVVKWEVSDEVQLRKRRKRNPRGKIKMNSKTKRKTTVSVKMTFPSKDYAIDAQGENVEAKKRTLSLWKTEKSAGATSPAFQMLVDLIADGYRRTSVAETA